MKSRPEELHDKYRDSNTTLNQAEDYIDELEKINTAEAHYYLWDIYDAPDRFREGWSWSFVYYPEQSDYVAKKYLCTSASAGNKSAIAIILSKYRYQFEVDFYLSLAQIASDASQIKSLCLCVYKEQKKSIDLIVQIQRIAEKRLSIEDQTSLQRELINITLEENKSNIEENNPLLLQFIKFLHALLLGKHGVSKDVSTATNLINQVFQRLNKDNSTQDISVEDQLFTVYFSHLRDYPHFGDLILELVEAIESGQCQIKKDSNDLIRKLERLNSINNHLRAKIIYMNMQVKHNIQNIDKIMTKYEEQIQSDLFKAIKKISPEDIKTLISSLEALQKYKEESITQDVALFREAAAKLLLAKLQFTIFDQSVFLKNITFDPISVKKDFQDILKMLQQCESDDSTKKLISDTYYYLCIMQRFKDVIQRDEWFTFLENYASVNLFDDEQVKNIKQVLSAIKNQSDLNDAQQKIIQSVELKFSFYDLIKRTLSVADFIQSHPKDLINILNQFYHYLSSFSINEQISHLNYFDDEKIPDTYRQKATLSLEKFIQDPEANHLTEAMKMLKLSLNYILPSKTTLNVIAYQEWFNQVYELAMQDNNFKISSEILNQLAELYKQYDGFFKCDSSEKIWLLYEKSVKQGNLAATYYLADQYFNEAHVVITSKNQTLNELISSETQKPSAPEIENEQQHLQKALDYYQLFLSRLRNSSDNYLNEIKKIFDHLEAMKNNDSELSNKAEKIYAEYLPIFYWQQLQFNQANWSNHFFADLTRDQTILILNFIFKKIDGLIGKNQIEIAEQCVNCLLNKPSVLNAYLKKANILLAKNQGKKALDCMNDMLTQYITDKDNEKKTSEKNLSILERNDLNQSEFNDVVQNLTHQLLETDVELYLASIKLYERLITHANKFAQAYKATFGELIALYEDGLKKYSTDMRFVNELTQLCCESKNIAAVIEVLKITGSAISAALDSKLPIPQIQELFKKFHTIIAELNRITDPAFQSQIHSTIETLEKEYALKLQSFSLTMLHEASGKNFSKTEEYVKHIIESEKDEKKILELMEGMVRSGSAVFAIQWVSKVEASKAVECLKFGLEQCLKHKRISVETFKKLSNQWSEGLRTIENKIMQNLEGNNENYKLLVPLLNCYSNSAKLGYLINATDFYRVFKLGIERKVTITLELWLQLSNNSEAGFSQLDSKLKNKITEDLEAYWIYRNFKTPIMDDEVEKLNKCTKTNAYANYLFGCLLERFNLPKKYGSASDRFAKAVLAGEDLALNKFKEHFEDKKIDALFILYQAACAHSDNANICKHLTDLMNELNQKERTLPYLFLSETKEKEFMLAVLTNNKTNLNYFAAKHWDFYIKQLNHLLLQSITMQGPMRSIASKLVKHVNEAIQLEKEIVDVNSVKEIEIKEKVESIEAMPKQVVKVDEQNREEIPEKQKDDEQNIVSIKASEAVDRDDDNEKTVETVVYQDLILPQQVENPAQVVAEANIEVKIVYQDLLPIQPEVSESQEAENPIVYQVNIDPNSIMGTAQKSEEKAEKKHEEIAVPVPVQQPGITKSKHILWQRREADAGNPFDRKTGAYVSKKKKKTNESICEKDKWKRSSL